jgi:hypothetical protein
MSVLVRRATATAGSFQRSLRACSHLATSILPPRSTGYVHTHDSCCTLSLSYLSPLPLIFITCRKHMAFIIILVGTRTSVQNPRGSFSTWQDVLKRMIRCQDAMRSFMIGQGVTIIICMAIWPSQHCTYWSLSSGYKHACNAMFRNCIQDVCTVHLISHLTVAAIVAYLHSCFSMICLRVFSKNPRMYMCMRHVHVHVTCDVFLETHCLCVYTSVREYLAILHRNISGIELGKPWSTDGA